MGVISTDTPSNVLPGLPPPPGTVPNFVNPYSIAGSLKATNILFIVLTSLTTLARIYTKLFIIKSYGWPDYTIVLAWLGLIIRIAVHWQNYQYGAGIHQWDVPITNLVSFAKVGYTSEVMYPIVLAITKISICLQFMNIFTPSYTRKYRLIQGFIFLNSSLFIASFFIALLQCNPRARAWNRTIPGTCLQYQHFIPAISIFNLVSDAFMLAFPIFCIWNLQMSRERKVGVLLIFLIGILALVASILFVIFSFLNNSSEDNTFVLTQVGHCTVGETSAGILVGNFICLPRFFRIYLSKIKNFLTIFSWGRRTNRQTHESDTPLDQRKYTPKSESSNYVELEDQHVRPAYPPTYDSPNFNSTASKVVISSPPKAQTSFNEGNHTSDRNGVWRSVLVEQDVHHV
ncbi:hypothetical protein EV356DRAFT_340296 [Viridothelium virens]|uniref:Rhodopsin domain-containing protein n=1 Tax=Viridothelium virens TaxID=1048519 RepID=A0A6A6GXH9_VIRVR|nr:hypothetical protein EV356DRAFT_340296 [Viridothelium virens]